MARIRVKPYVGSRIAHSGLNASAEALTANFNQQIRGLVDAIADFTRQFDNITPDIMIEALEPTFGKAIGYTPVKDGDLVNSAYLEVESQRGRHVAVIGFGRGGKPDYAIYVHEMPYAHAAPTRSKFLESALDEDFGLIRRNLINGLREAVGT